MMNGQVGNYIHPFDDSDKNSRVSLNLKENSRGQQFIVLPKYDQELNDGINFRDMEKFNDAR